MANPEEPKDAVEPHEPQSDLLSTGAVAKLVGVSRQAVLAAVETGRLRPSPRPGPRGAHLFPRAEALKWGVGVRRPRRRRRAAQPAAVSASGVEPIGGQVPPASDAAGLRGTPAVRYSIDAALGRIVAARAVSADVTAAYRAALMADAERRKLAADVESERLRFERERIAAERREVQIARRKAEHDSHVRQLAGRFRRAKTGEKWPEAIVEALETALARVLGALSDDVLADAAQSGTLVEDAFATAWNTFDASFRQQPVGVEKPGVQNDLARRWLAAIRAVIRPTAGGTPVKAEKPGQ